MQVLFVDVGQGSCQVILLGGGRAIVIDAGASPGTALRMLKLLRIDTIELLVVSHSHLDHSGGVAGRKPFQPTEVAGILVSHARAIHRVAYVFDSQMRHRPFGRLLVKLLKDRVYRKEQLTNIEASDNPMPLWFSADGYTALAAISPLAGDHLLAFDADNPNASSAIIELRHRGDKVVFAADSEFDQWRDVYRLRGETPLTCKAISLPHHGGLMQGTPADLEWFCNQAIEAEVVVVSVATVNRHGHPREEVIHAVTASGSQVMCTQITEQCCDDLESLRPGVIGAIHHPCLSSSRPSVTRNARRSRNVACAGTISALLTEDGIAVERRDQHRAGVDRLVNDRHTPLCRR